MIFKTKVTSIYECSLERAFKTPMLCDIAKVHTGHLFISPKVSHSIDKGNWGEVGSSKKIITKKSITQNGGFIFIDRVVERVENEYWKLQIDDFQSWSAGFYKFIVDWRTTQIEEGKVLVEYEYSLFSNKAIFYPLNWLFVKIFWKSYLKRVVNNIKIMAYNNEPYLYE